MMNTNFMSSIALALALTVAGTIGLASDSIVMTTGTIDFGGLSDPEPLLPVCGTCHWTNDIAKEDIINSEACPPPLFPSQVRQKLNWHCARYECGTVPYHWYAAVIDSGGPCTADALFAGSCPGSNCSGGP